MPRYANTLTRMHISASQQLRGTRSHSGHTFRIIRLRCHRATHRVTDTVGLLYYTPLRLRMRTLFSPLVVSVSVHTRCAVLPPSLSLATDCDCSRCMVANGVCLPLGIVCRICKKLLMCHGCIGEETQSSSSVRTVTSRTFQRIIGVSARVEIASVAPLGQRGCSINNCARRLSKCSAPDASRGVREPDARLCLHACECTQGAHVSELWFGRGQLPFDMLRMCGAAPILHRLV